MRQKITCPETAHLEEIEFDENPVDGKILGVRGCSRFHPPGTVDCDAVCIHRLNKRMEADHGDVAPTERDDAIVHSSDDAIVHSNDD